MWMTMPSRVTRFGAKENIFGLMMTGLGKVASKAFGLDALKSLWIGFGRIRGSKPRMAGTMEVSFWTNLGVGLAIPSKDKIKGAKP